MALSVNQLELLKSCYLEYGKSKQEKADILTDKTFKMAAEALDDILRQGHCIGLDVLLLALEKKQIQHIEKFQLVIEYFNAVLKANRQECIFTPTTDKALIQKIHSAFRMDEPIDLNLNSDARQKDTSDTIVRQTHETHEIVDSTLRKISRGMSAVSFPEIVVHDLSVNDYKEFVYKLAATNAQSRCLKHLTLTYANEAALQGLSEHYASNGELEVSHLHLKLNEQALSDNCIENIVRTLLSLPYARVKEVSIESDEMISDLQWQTLVTKVIGNKIPIKVNLPDNLKASEYQRQLDINSSNSLRDCRIHALNAKQETKRKMAPREAKKHKRARVLKRSAQIEIELQQQQQMQVPIKKVLDEEESDIEGINIITFDKLYKRLADGTFPVARDKCFITGLALKKSWNSWFGHVVTYQTKDGDVVDADNAGASSHEFNVHENNLFQHITEEACLMLLNHRDQFRYGIDYKNLPVGFQLIQHPAGLGKVLHYQESISAANQQSDLSVKLNSDAHAEFPCHQVIHELLEAYGEMKHKSYPVLLGLTQQLEKSAKYDRELVEAVYRLLPKLFLYQPGDLELIIKYSSEDGVISPDKLKALVCFHDVNQDNDVHHSDDLLSSQLSKIITKPNDLARYLKIKRHASLEKEHPVCLMLRSDKNIHLQKWIKVMRLSGVELDALYDVYIYYGTQGLEKVVSLSGQFGKKFDELRNSFSHGSNYLQLFSDERTESTVNQLLSDKSELTDIEKTWFMKLLSQHAGSVKNFNLTDLFEAFVAFIRKINMYHLECYLPIAFHDIKNMQVALGRMLTILEKTDETERLAQWECITRLPLQADGAIKAIQDNTPGNRVCNVIVPEMLTTPIHFAARIGHEYADSKLIDGEKSPEHGYAVMNGFKNLARRQSIYINADKHTLKRNFIDSEFYRFITHQEYRRPIGEYPELLDYIHRKKFQPELAIYIYRILAETSTGRDNYFENIKFSKDEFKSKFFSFVDEIDRLNLGAGIMMLLQPIAAAAALSYKAKGQDLMVDGLLAPHKSYSINDVVKHFIIEQTMRGMDTVPAVSLLRILMKFIANGVHDIDAVKLMKSMNDYEEPEEFRILRELSMLPGGGYLQAFCEGLRYLPEKDLSSFNACKQYFNSVKNIQSQLSRHLSTNFVSQRFNPYDLSKNNRELVISDENATIIKSIISVISTFDMRDEVLAICEKNMRALIEAPNRELIVMGLTCLRGIDLDLGAQSGKPKLTPEDFEKILTRLIRLSNQDEVDKDDVLYFIRRQFGAYITDEYLNSLRDSPITAELHKAVEMIFPLESQQKQIVALLNTYQNKNDIKQYERFLQLLEQCNKRLIASEMSALLDHLRVIGEISVTASDAAKPGLEEINHLLEILLNKNSFNVLAYFISSTESEIRKSPNQKITSALCHNYLAKASCYLASVSNIYDDKLEKTLSQAELLSITSKYVNYTNAAEIEKPSVDFSEIDTHFTLLTNLFIRSGGSLYELPAIEIRKKLVSILIDKPSLSRMPAFLELQAHIDEVIKARERLLPVSSLQKEIIIEGGNSRNNESRSVISGLKKIKMKVVEKFAAVKESRRLKSAMGGSKTSTMSNSISVRIDIIDSFRSALKEQHDYNLTFMGKLTSIVDDIRTLVERYPAARQEIINFFDGYAISQHIQDLNVSFIPKNVNVATKLFLDLGDIKTVFALCFHFDGKVEGQSLTPSLLMLIINHKLFKDHAIEHKKILLSILVKLLNNDNLYSLDSFIDLLSRLPQPMTDDKLELLNSMYMLAPYPSLNLVQAWMEDTQTLTNNYKAYQNKPCRRECGDNQPNGFKLREAFVKRDEVNGIILSNDELKALYEATVSVRALSIEQLKTDLANVSAGPNINIALLVALTAELLYRAKGLTPIDESEASLQWGSSFEINTTQYLAIYSMLKSGEHVTAEIISGEGKTRISMIHLACQFAMGKTVDFVTSDISLAYREFSEYQSYFELLGAESRLIHADTPAGHYAMKGINFSDPASLELFRNRAYSEGKSHMVIDPDPERRALLLDEGDKTFFDLDDTRFNYSASCDETLRDMAWVYPLLMAYFQVRDRNKPDQYYYENILDNDIDECRKQFFHYINKRHVPAVTSEQFARLKMISQAQLESWFGAALTARDLQFNHDFTITAGDIVMTNQGPKVATEAKLIIDSRKDERSRFSFGVHQCLHARINYLLSDIKNKTVGNDVDPALLQVLLKCNQPAHIESEKQIIYSSSSKTLLKSYENGTLYAVSGTPGSVSEHAEAEILYAHKKLNGSQPSKRMHFIEIPRHKKLQRKDRPIKLAFNDNQEIEMIVNEILLSRRRNQPTMIVCADDAECHRVALQVKAFMDKKKIPLDDAFIIDADTSIEDEADLIRNKIGRAKAVTFTTPKLGRGVDIRVHKGDGKHVPDATTHGLKVVITGTMMRYRDYLQVIARAGRFGAKGESRVILNKTRLKKQLGKTTLNDGFYTSPQAYIRHQQALIDRYKQRKRLIKFTYVDYRDQLQRSLFHDFQPGLPDTVRAKMINLWQVCARELDQKWSSIYENIVGTLDQTQIDEVAIDDGLKEMYQFASQQWSILYRGLADDPEIKLHHPSHLRRLMADVPVFKLDDVCLQLLKSSNNIEAMPKAPTVYEKYDSAHDGQVAIYKRRFELLRATLTGKRRLFADLRAWWEGRGIILANLRAAIHKDITFAQLIFGVRKNEIKAKSNNLQYSTAKVTEQLGGKTFDELPTKANNNRREIAEHPAPLFSATAKNDSNTENAFKLARQN